MKNVKFILTTLVAVFALLSFWWFFFNRPDTEDKKTEPQIKVESGYTIIAFGDSLTAGYGLPLSESYPSQLEKKLQALGKKVTVINAGISGETTRGNYERASFIKDQRPDMIIWGIGGNDALRALPLSETRNNMEKTLETLLGGDSRPQVVILGMQAPLNTGALYKSEFDALYDSLAKKHNLPLVPFLIADVFLNKELMLPDGIHPNQKGYEKIIEEKLLKTVIERVP